MKKLTLIAAALAALTVGVANAAPAEPISPVEPVKITNPKLVDLGRMLWFEPRLSRSGFISCNSCHNLATGGVDNLKTSIGDYWAQGPINSPTVLNSSGQIAQFWDGRAKTLQEQAAGPIANPLEMASTHALAVEVIASIPGYRPIFKVAFGDDKVDIDRITKAIAAFEETLVTPNSRFDKWLKGDKKAITSEELAGYQVFKSSGCTMCHNGEKVGGSSFMKMGLVKPYKTTNTATGVQAVSGKDQDRMTFKVPILRNVELTYPYFHDGAAQTLEQAVEVMGDVQLGRRYTAEEVKQITAFLKTLTGDQPQVVYPILPPSSNATPIFDPWAKKASK
ncbi:MAG: cytochrome-c peroxidase [Sutterellaceae bacterium]|nr:cytochrome-c peroxidase [Sutterellaceae bacterium]